MHKKIMIAIVIIAILLFAEAIILQVIRTPSTDEQYVSKTPSRKILYVGGSHGSYTRINDAINNVRRGDTIFVNSGTYHENIILDKAISLVGENKDTTIIDGGGSRDVVKITVDRVILSNFTLHNSGEGSEHLNDATINIISNNNIIQNNICLGTNYGIWVQDSVGNIIENNSCVAKYDGIWLMNSGNNILKNNSMIGCGLVLDGRSLADFMQDIDTSNTVNNKPVYYYKNKINKKTPSDAGQVILVNCRNCVVSNLEIYNVTDGIEIIFSDKNTIKNNKIIGTTDFAIRLFKSNYNTITNNICSENPIGLGFGSGGSWIYKNPADCKHNIINKNTISNNHYCGILFDSSDDNTISKNNFIGNNKDIDSTDSHNKFYSNYWDKWIGVKHKMLRFIPKIIWEKRHLRLFPTLLFPHPSIDRNPQKESIIQL